MGFYRGIGYLAIGAVLLSACGGGSSQDVTDEEVIRPSVDDPSKIIPVEKNVSITDEYQVENFGFNPKIHTTVSIGDQPKNLYILLTNRSSTSSNGVITHNAKSTVPRLNKSVESSHSEHKPHNVHRPKYVEDFSPKLVALRSNKSNGLPQTKVVPFTQNMKDVAGESKEFYLDASGTRTTYATARKIIANVPTAFGSKTLNVWVSNDSFGEGCSKARCVTQDMVDAFADYFLASGEDNDIYDWVTNIFGEEWGSAAQLKYSNLISEDDSITILLTDIEQDNSANGGVVGFFWAKDNYKKSVISGSNERVMFYADSVMFANGEGSWDIDDFWPKEMVSTLAHEFQHMIHFYQKTILLLSENSDDTDTWINEMLSESVEDLIATKIKHIGSRGVDPFDGSAGEIGNIEGRYPLFNENNTLSLTQWTNALADYSKVNAFAAYLTRNYGGAKILHDIMYSPHIDKQAVVETVNNIPGGEGKTFHDLVREWGTAVMLSDIDNLIDLPFYNTGDFTYNNYNGMTYEMGSINFFNYSPKPEIYSTSGLVAPDGNYYYKIGENLTGDVSIDLTLNGDTEATLIAK